MMDDNLTLPEELLLLALDDRTGKSRAGAALPFGLAAATLVDLALRGHLSLQDEMIAVGDAAPTGNSVLDDAKALIAGEAKPKKPAVWVGAVAQKLKKLPDRVAKPLGRARPPRPSPARGERIAAHRRAHRGAGCAHRTARASSATSSPEPNRPRPAWPRDCSSPPIAPPRGPGDR